ncbi:hypothetical protein NMG60_11009148 [Bertholletia excelsa]
MVSLFTVPNSSFVPSRFLLDLNFPAISLPVLVVISPRSQLRRRRLSVCVDLESYSVGFGELSLRRRHIEGSWCCWCKNWESEGDSALEAEILEFMKQSEKPEVFPTRQELVDAGRTDLAEAIVKRGGWLSLGWDLDEDNEEDVVQDIGISTGASDAGEMKVQEDDMASEDCESGVPLSCVTSDFQDRNESRQESMGVDIGREAGCLGISSMSGTASDLPSSSGRPFEMGDEQQMGIEGILKGLERHRNLSFGINLEKNGYYVDSSRKCSRDDSRTESSKVLDSVDLGRSNSRLRSGSSLKPQTWQTWSIQRAGVSDAEFEAAEISFNDDLRHTEKNASKNEIHKVKECSAETLVAEKEITYSEIQGRLQDMELELASALLLLRSKRDKFGSTEGHETSKDLWKLSDTWEFQENEIMNAQDKLRSIRAKMAILEGKMSLAIVEAQKIFEEKQKGIDVAHRALQLLRTTCIVWPNSASEVLLAGSFDGWSSQRKMEKSSTGIFSVCLKLYPGRYEIKFIVDGIWKTDPLRPIVNNNGYENNVLIVN